MNLDDRYLIQQLFQSVTLATKALCQALREENERPEGSFIWLDLNAEKRIDISDPIERLCLILNLYTLHESQKPKTVLVCPGFVAATPKVFQLFEEMNQARKAFQEKMVVVRKALLGIKDSTIDNQFGNPTHDRPQLVDSFLKDIKLDHLHFKHVYRCAPMLTIQPAQLGWTWALTQSIKKITREQALELVGRRNSKGQFDRDLEKLTLLPHKTPLSLRQDLAPHLRINWTDYSGKRKMLKGTLPVVFPKRDILPILRPARPLEDRLISEDSEQIEKPEKTFRKDRTIGESPFIACIRAFLEKNQEKAFYAKYPQYDPKKAKDVGSLFSLS
jgi:hypothetical protein